MKRLRQVLFSVVTCWTIRFSAGRTSSHDENLVLIDGHWTKVPPDTWGTPTPPYDDRWKRDDSKIIILIAALRETRLVDTIKSAFDNASFPERITVGVVQQNEADDVDCIEQLCAERGRPLVRIDDEDEGSSDVSYLNPFECVEFDRVRVLRMDAIDAAGPVFARGHQPGLVHEEDFCMQIDAHTIFAEKWDVDMLNQWGATENEFAVLSTYPTNYKDLGKSSNNHWEMPHICGVNLSPSGQISNKQAGAIANMNRPMLAPLWAAGLSFSRCHAERRVPNDINLRQIFSGEEFSRGARLWTNGYDFYSITRPIIGVYYGRDKGNKGSWKGDSVYLDRSLSRLRTLLKMPGSDQSEHAIAELGMYNLGTKRTLEQYAAFSGVDTQRLVARDKCLVKYVPWNSSGLELSISAEDRNVLERYDVKTYQKRYSKRKNTKTSEDHPALNFRGSMFMAETEAGLKKDGSRDTRTGKKAGRFILISGLVMLILLLVVLAMLAGQHDVRAKQR